MCTFTRVDNKAWVSISLEHSSLTFSMLKSGLSNVFKTLVLKHGRPMSLDREEAFDHTRPPLSITGATLVNVLGVVGRNDVLARLRVVHDRVMMREEAIEAHIEDTRGEEGVDIADGEPVQTNC